VLAGCQTTQERSAELERAALRAHKSSVAVAGLRITRASTQVRVLAQTLVRGSEGAAAVVTVRNETAHGLRAVRIAIEVRDASGAVVYSNTTSGLATSLTGIPYLAPHATFTWVDDQVQSTAAAKLSAKVGEAAVLAGAAPVVTVSGVRAFQDPANGAGAEGQVANRSTLAQHELVLYAIARRGTSVIAAGRAVIPSLADGQSTRFQAYFVGNPLGGAIEVEAPPATLP
jgi:hypothetical protein